MRVKVLFALCAVFAVVCASFASARAVTAASEREAELSRLLSAALSPVDDDAAPEPEVQHEDPLAQVRAVIDNLHRIMTLNDLEEMEKRGENGKDGEVSFLEEGEKGAGEASTDDDAAVVTSFVETGAMVTSKVQKVRSYCEICILVMQLKERGQPHLCAGLNANYYVTCIENLESLLRADKALVYWLKNGCMHMDSTGPEIVRPCPAMPICSWVPNLFAQPPSLVRDGIESLCPKDPKFLPTIPNEYKTLLQPQTTTVAGPGNK